jgi:hypothetical protein
MIELKDVRVGNWLMLDNERVWSKKYNKTNQQVTIDTLIEISSNENYYSPIKLTEEILLKCGYSESDLENGKILVVGESFDNVIGYTISSLSSSIVVKTVHQLQNLVYALTNKELEILW